MVPDVGRLPKCGRRRGHYTLGGRVFKASGRLRVPRGSEDLDLEVVCLVRVAGLAGGQATAACTPRPRKCGGEIM